jgi:hypothetical protein
MMIAKFGWNAHEGRGRGQNVGLRTWQAPIPDGDWRATKSVRLLVPTPAITEARIMSVKSSQQ